LFLEIQLQNEKIEKGEEKEKVENKNKNIPLYETSLSF
jgi:hypothetical protein